MRSATPKVLHEICGRSLLGHAVTAARSLQPQRLLVVVGHGREAVIAHLELVDAGAEVAVQEEQLGTAHAVQVVLAALDARGQPLRGTVMITSADVPLLTGGTLAALLAAHENEGNAATVASAVVPDPTGYGRILRDGSGAVVGVAEQRDATPDELTIAEINSGIYAFDAETLRTALESVGDRNAQGERYLPDVLRIAHATGQRVGAFPVADHDEVLGVNDRVQLAEVRRLMNARMLTEWMRAGVTIVDPATTWVDVDVTLEPDVVLFPGVMLEGATSVGAGTRIGPASTLRDAVVGEGATVVRSHLVGAQVGAGAEVGPYAYLRPGAVLGLDAKAGTFVEIKAATLGRGTKVPHLTYVGDADVGDGTNIGAASVFVNYDGVEKHRTVVGEHCRTGSDTMFIAPVTIGDGAYTAAGSVITQDVPPGAMAVARAKQRNIPGWVLRRRPGTQAAQAAEHALERIRQTVAENEAGEHGEGAGP
jgi:bifunctional UDP-N-acetylglucosamine pyrophosphorylase/glucosamine-1-phosphate N-acetyltransferase